MTSVGTQNLDPIVNSQLQIEKLVRETVTAILTAVERSERHFELRYRKMFNAGDIDWDKNTGKATSQSVSDIIAELLNCLREGIDAYDSEVKKAEKELLDIVNDSITELLQQNGIDNISPVDKEQFSHVLNAFYMNHVEVGTAPVDVASDMWGMYLSSDGEANLTDWLVDKSIDEVSYLIKNSKTTTNTEEGLLTANKNRLWTVIRTHLYAIANVLRLKFITNNPKSIYGIQFVATLDNRTSRNCGNLDGRIWRPEEFSQVIIPPVHPNCRSALVPCLKKTIDGLPVATAHHLASNVDIKGNAKQIYQREAQTRMQKCPWERLPYSQKLKYLDKAEKEYERKTGKPVYETIQSVETFEEWFDRQPDEFKRGYMTVSEYRLYSVGKLKPKYHPPADANLKIKRTRSKLKVDLTDAVLFRTEGSVEFYETPDGKRYAVKKMNDFLEHELMAQDFYRSMGVSVPESKKMHLNGVDVKVSEYIEGETLEEWWEHANKTARAKMSKRLREQLDVDIVTGNWSAFRNGNVIVDKEGKPWRVNVRDTFNLFNGKQKRSKDWDEGFPDDLWLLTGHGRSLNANKQARAYFNGTEHLGRLLGDSKDGFFVKDTANSICARKWDKSLKTLPTQLQSIVKNRLDEITQLHLRAVEYDEYGYLPKYTDKILDYSYTLSKQGMREAVAGEIKGNTFFRPSSDAFRKILSAETEEEKIEKAFFALSDWGGVGQVKYSRQMRTDYKNCLERCKQWLPTLQRGGYDNGQQYIDWLAKVEQHGFKRRGEISKVSFPRLSTHLRSYDSQWLNAPDVRDASEYASFADMTYSFIDGRRKYGDSLFGGMEAEFNYGLRYKFNMFAERDTYVDNPDIGAKNAISGVGAKYVYYNMYGDTYDTHRQLKDYFFPSDLIENWGLGQYDSSYTDQACYIKVVKSHLLGNDDWKNCQTADEWNQVMPWFSRDRAQDSGFQRGGISNALYHYRLGGDDLLDMDTDTFLKYQSAVQLVSENANIVGKSKQSRSILAIRTEKFEDIYPDKCPAVNSLCWHKVGVNESATYNKITVVEGDNITVTEVPYARISSYCFLPGTEDTDYVGGDLKDVSLFFSQEGEGEIGIDTRGLKILYVGSQSDMQTRYNIPDIDSRFMTDPIATKIRKDIHLATKRTVKIKK